MKNGMTGMEFSKGLRAGPYAWPGGYPMYLLTLDGNVLCFACAEKEKAAIRLAAMTNDRGGWRPAGFAVNWEDSDLHCDHCGERIESAYAEQE